MTVTLLTNAAESNRGILRYIAESSWGTTPASGQVRTMRITSSSLMANKSTKVSDEIRADRMVSNVVEVAAMTEGDIGWEMSAGGQDEFYEHFLLSSFSKDMNFMLMKGAGVDITTTSKVVLSGVDMTEWLVNNRWIKLEGFTNLANNGYFKISSFSFTGGNTEITTVETTLVVEAGNAYSKIMDANDVLAKATDFTFTSGNKITKTGWTTGLGLQPGQKLWVDGLGKETGAIDFLAEVPADNATFTLFDSVNTVRFEFASAQNLASPGNVWVQSGLPDAEAAAFCSQLMDQFRKHNIRIYGSVVAGTKEAGDIVFSAVAEAGDTVTIDDGNAVTVFTFAASGNGLTGAAVNVAVGADANASATNLFNAINANTNISCTATNGTPGTVDIENNRYLGGAITKSDADNDYAVTDFSGGDAPSVALTNGYYTGGAITEALAQITATAFSGGSSTKGGRFVTIASIPDADNVVVSETLTADANGGTLTVVVKGSHLRNPGDPLDIVKKSMSFETGFTDVTKYLGHNGMRLGSFKTSISPGEIVKGSFSFMGRQTAALDATVLGTSPYTQRDTTSTEVFNGTSNVNNVTRNGEALTTAVLKIDIDGDAGLRQQPAVGAKFPAGIGYGRFNLKGSLTAYFQNFDLYRDFLNHTTASLAWDMSDADLNTYFFTVPSIKYLTDPLTLEGIDKDVTEEISWTAQRDATLGTMYMIDRFSSVWPTTVA